MVPFANRPVRGAGSRNVAAPRADQVSRTRRSLAVSNDAVDSDLKRCAHLAHALVAQLSEPLDEHGDRHTLDRVKVEGAAPNDRIILGVRGRPRSQGRGSWWCTVRQGCAGGGVSLRLGTGRRLGGGRSREVRTTTPPLAGVSPSRGPAASRKEARSPHSSGSSSGCWSYALYSASTSAARLRATRALRASSTNTASVTPARTRRARAKSASSTVVLNRTRDMPQSCHNRAGDRRRRRRI